MRSGRVVGDVVGRAPLVPVVGDDITGLVGGTADPWSEVLAAGVVVRGRRGSDRPHRDRHRDAYGPESSADGVGLQVLFGEREQVDVAVDGDIRTVADVRVDAAVGDPDVDRTGGSDEAASQPASDCQRAEVVDGSHAERLVTVIAGNALVDLGTAADVGEDGRGEDPNPNATRDAHEPAAEGRRQAEQLLARAGLHGETLHPSLLEHVPAVAVIDVEAVRTLPEGDHDVRAAEVGLGVLRNERDGDSRADAYDAARQRGGYGRDLAQVGRHDGHVVVGVQGDVGAGVGVGRVLEDGDVGRPGHAHYASASPCGHRHDCVLGARRDRDVVAGEDLRVVAHGGFGVESDDPNCRTGADTDGAAGYVCVDAELVELVPGGDEDRLTEPGPGCVAAAAGVTVDLDVAANGGFGGGLHDRDAAGEGDRSRAADGDGHAHRSDVVTVGGGDRDAVEGGVRRGGARRRALIGGVPGRTLAFGD